jgi:hypothetical protein
MAPPPTAHFTTCPALARSAETFWVLRRQVVSGLLPVTPGAVGVALSARWGMTLLVVAAFELAVLAAIRPASGWLRERARVDHRERAHCRRFAPLRGAQC